MKETVLRAIGHFIGYCLVAGLAFLAVAFMFKALIVLAGVL